MREAKVTIGAEEYETLGIDGLVNLCRVAGLREFDELACHGDGAIFQVELENRLDEETLETLEYVDQWELVTIDEECYIYVIGFTAPALSDDITEYAEDLVGTCDPKIGDRGATMTFVGSQESIRGLIREYVNAGLSPDLRKLGSYEGETKALSHLTDRQREVLETAFQAGYYDVPRKASAEEIAMELGVDASTVAEHLQRAERNLLTQHLATPA
jgi:DNA-binding CsgD family transcriptional regulator